MIESCGFFVLLRAPPVKQTPYFKNDIAVKHHRCVDNATDTDDIETSETRREKGCQEAIRISSLQENYFYAFTTPFNFFASSLVNRTLASLERLYAAVSP